MRWDVAEAGAALERIWDLHDRLSDAILASSRSRSRAVSAAAFTHRCGCRGGGGGGRNGCVFIKGGGGEDEGASLAAAVEAVAEARSLHAIRSALEDLKDNLEFLHVRLLPPLFCLPVAPQPF
jgi:hypothetical protein